MKKYIIITAKEDSESYKNIGTKYVFDEKYRYLFNSNTVVVYYKSACYPDVQKKWKETLAHYFGFAEIKEISNMCIKNKYECNLMNYFEFEKVKIKNTLRGFDSFDPNRPVDVRSISENEFNELLKNVTLIEHNKYEIEQYKPIENTLITELMEGEKKLIYATKYERKKILRDQAIIIHGVTCQACGFNFEFTYGSIGKNYIQVHHNKPLSLSGVQKINPLTDLNVVCSNCHSIIHKEKASVLSIEDVKKCLTTAST